MSSAIFVLILCGAIFLSRALKFLPAQGLLTELAMGIALGNWIGPAPHFFLTLGAAFLLFEVGLDSDVRKLVSLRKDALRTALLGVALPVTLGFPLLYWGLDVSFDSSLIMAFALTATSIGVTAKTLQNLGALQSVSGQIILGAAVIDDVLGVMILAGTLTMVSSAPPAIYFFEILPFLGAFGLGLSLRLPLESKVGQIKALSSWVVPLFFICTGMSIPMAAFKAPGFLALGGVLLFAAFFGKLACGYLISDHARKIGASRSIIGVGMLPRGEVGLIFANAGLGLSLLDPSQFAAVVLMVLVTTVSAPVLLEKALKRASLR